MRIIYPMPFGFAEMFVHGPATDAKRRNSREVKIKDAFDKPIPWPPELVTLALTGTQTDIEKLERIAAITRQFGDSNDSGRASHELSVKITHFKEQLNSLQAAFDKGEPQNSAPFVVLRRQMLEAENAFMDLQVEKIGMSLVACNRALPQKLSALLALKALLDGDIAFLKLILRGYPPSEATPVGAQDQELLRRFDSDLLKLFQENDFVHILTGDKYSAMCRELAEHPQLKKDDESNVSESFLIEHVGLEGDFYRIAPRFRPIINSYNQLLDQAGFKSVHSGTIGMRTVSALFRGHFELFRDLGVISNDDNSEGPQEQDGWNFSAKGLHILKQVFLKHADSLIPKAPAAHKDASDNKAVSDYAQGRLNVSIEFY